MEEKIQVTKSGYGEIERELNERINIIRPDLAVRIADARALGDLSENAEYHTARDDARANESRIEELEDLIKRVIIIEEKKHIKGELFAKITILKNNQEEIIYQLVNSKEADIKLGKLSIESPVGTLLIGKKAGDEFSHKTLKSDTHYRVISIE